MSNNKSILLVAPNFNELNTSACNLVVKIGMDNFSYAVIDNANQQVVALYDEQECDIDTLKLKELFEKNAHLNLAYQQTKIAVYTDDEISIPADLFEENSIDLHSKLIKNNTSINIFKQAQFGFNTIFGLSKSVQNAIANQLGNVKMYPHYAGLLALAEHTANAQLFLDFTANSFTALLIKDQQVIFQKSYETENAEELNYFILLLINQLTISTNEITVQLSGIIHQDDHKYQCLQKYFSKIEFAKLATGLNLELLEDMPAHYYTNLIALAQCE